MEFFSIDHLEKSVSSDIKKAQKKIKSKVADYSCKCPPGSSSGKNKRPIHLDKHHGDDDGRTPHPGKSKIDKVIINNVKFNNCQNKTQGHCIDDIYTYDDFGLPTSQNTPSSSDKNLLYTKNGEYVPNPSNTIKFNNNHCNSQYGCCADDRTSATAKGANCKGFDYTSGLTGSPVSVLNNSALGGTKRMFIDKSSGNSYIPYIKSNLRVPHVKETFSTNGSLSENTRRRHNICSITKYAMLICIILIIVLIICVYTRRQ